MSLYASYAASNAARGGGTPSDPAAIALLVKVSGLASISANVPIIWDTIFAETNPGAYDDTTGEFTAPTAGWYRCSMYINAATASRKYSVFINGSVYCPLVSSSPSANVGECGSMSFPVAADDVITVCCVSGTTGTINESFFSLEFIGAQP